MLTKNGVYDTFDLAPSSTGVYYVTNKDTTLVHLTNAGVAASAKTHLVVNQMLSGPSAVQALFVTGNAIVVDLSFGQGTDAEIYAYNATSLQGPGKGSAFSDGAILGATTAGLLVVANPEAGILPDLLPPAVPAQVRAGRHRRLRQHHQAVLRLLRHDPRATGRDRRADQEQAARPTHRLTENGQDNLIEQRGGCHGYG